jgi:hypothetical protein
MRALPARGSHPRHADRLRHFLVRYGPLRLTAIFILLLVMVAALLALGLAIDSGDRGSFFGLWRDEGMALLGLTIKAPDANTGSIVSQAIRTLQGLLGLILLAIYTAVIVFRLFIHPKVFVFRERITVQPAPRETFKGEFDRNAYVLAIRLYNASSLRALEVEFNVIHQRWFGSAENSVVRNVPLPVANPNWPMADRPVPYTLFVQLKVGDVVQDGDRLLLETIQGEEFSENDRLVVHVCGSMPEVGKTFIERHAFELPEAITDERYGVIRLNNYHADPRTWGGWEGFDA